MMTLTSPPPAGWREKRWKTLEEFSWSTASSPRRRQRWTTFSPMSMFPRLEGETRGIKTGCLLGHRKEDKKYPGCWHSGHWNKGTGEWGRYLGQGFSQVPLVHHRFRTSRRQKCPKICELIWNTWKIIILRKSSGLKERWTPTGRYPRLFGG